MSLEKRKKLIHRQNGLGASTKTNLLLWMLQANGTVLFSKHMLSVWYLFFFFFNSPVHTMTYLSIYVSNHNSNLCSCEQTSLIHQFDIVIAVVVLVFWHLSYSCEYLGQNLFALTKNKSTKKEGKEKFVFFFLAFFTTLV